MHPDERALALRVRIEAAFADVPLPIGRNFTEHDSLDDIWCREHLEGMSWRELAEAGPDRFTDCMHCMRPQAVLYYFPVYMLDLLPAREDAAVMFWWMEGYLRQRANQLRVYPKFSHEQLGCVVEFLRYLLDHVREYESEIKYHRRLERRVAVTLDAWISFSRTSPSAP